MIWLQRCGGRSCDFECTAGGIAPDRRHEFIGPVKIIFVDPAHEDYMWKVWGSAIITFAYLLIAATFIPIIYFTLTFILPVTQNIHVAACTTGFHLLLPSAILMFDPLFNGCLNLSYGKKICQHIYIQFFALVCIFGGAAHLYRTTEIIQNTSHAILGLISTSLAGLTTLMGLLALYFRLKQHGDQTHTSASSYCHRKLGILTMITSMLTLCTGVFKPSFLNWVHTIFLDELPYALAACSSVYTLCIIISISMRKYAQ